MRILFLTQFFDPEPVVIPGFTFASWLSQRGHEVEVLTGFPNYPGGAFYPDYPVRPYRRESHGDVKVIRVPLYPSHDRSGLGRVANYASFALSASSIGSILSRRPDVVYVYHPPATVGLPAILWKVIRRAPFLYHLQDMWPESVMASGMMPTKVPLRESSRLLIEWWCQRIYRQAGVLVVISPGFRRMLIQRGVDPAKVHVVPNWAEETIFFPAPRDEHLSDELGLTGYFNVVYAGNLGFFQDLQVAILAASRVRNLSRFRLVFVGTGQAEGELRSLAARLGAENVRFVERRPLNTMGALTNLADVLLVSLQDLPFFSSTIPGKTQTALAAGKPIVITVRGDAAEMVAAACAGEVVPPGDVRLLAEAFERLYRSPPATLTSIGLSGRQYYERELSFRRGASRIEALLTAIA